MYAVITNHDRMIRRAYLDKANIDNISDIVPATVIEIGESIWCICVGADHSQIYGCFASEEDADALAAKINGEEGYEYAIVCKTRISDDYALDYVATDDDWRNDDNF